MRLKHQLCSQQRLFLVLPDMGPIDDIGDKLRSEGQFHLAAIHKRHLFLVHHEQVVAARLTGNIDVLAQLDIAVCSQDEQASVAPDTQVH